MAAPGWLSALFSSSCLGDMEGSVSLGCLSTAFSDFLFFCIRCNIRPHPSLLTGICDRRGTAVLAMHGH